MKKGEKYELRAIWNGKNFTSPYSKVVYEMFTNLIKRGYTRRIESVTKVLATNKSKTVSMTFPVFVVQVENLRTKGQK